MDVAVIEVSQDENAYVLPVEISEEALDYFSFDDIMRLAYWLGNFWVGVQYEINNRPEEIRVVEQRGLISPDDDAYKSQDRIVLIKRIIAADKDRRPIEYGATGSGRKYHVPAWGVRGHERTLSDGRVIMVRPYRKGKERNNPEIYREKRYVFDDEKIDDDTSKK